MVKYCAGCDQEKPVSEFHRRGKTGYQYKCKPCSNAARVEHYKSNRKHQIALNEAWRKRRVEWLRSLKEGPCTDCGKSFNPVAMQWDHIGTDKAFDISNGTSKPKQTILNEIAKCELVCANCHAVRTWQRRQNGTVSPRSDKA